MCIEIIAKVDKKRLLLGSFVVRIFLTSLLTSCAFNFDLTSQRTALENQIIGSYDEIDEDLVLVASLRNEQVKTKSDKKKRDKDRTLDTKLNQEFNRDDIDQLKNAQVIGETKNGGISLLPGGTGLRNEATKEQIKLAELLVLEENRDRIVNLEQAILETGDPTEENRNQFIRSFVKLKRDGALLGHWLQDDEGNWYQKVQ